MKSLVFAAGIALAATSFAQAQTTVIERPAPSAVIVEKHEAPVVEHRTVETHGCATTTVRKENDMGDSKTVTKKECD